MYRWARPTISVADALGEPPPPWLEHARLRPRDLQVPQQVTPSERRHGSPGSRPGPKIIDEVARPAGSTVDAGRFVTP